MSNLTTQVQTYLRDIDELEASTFLDDCIIENFYIDSLFSDSDEYMTNLYDIIIYVPAKKFKSLNENARTTEIIEKGIHENADGDGVQIRSMSWKLLTKTLQETTELAKGDEIINLLNDDNYVKTKIQLMNSNIQKAPHLAIGTAKELIETCCKSILNYHTVTIDINWDILKLVKETNKVMTFANAGAKDSELKQSISLVIGGLANVVHGIAELRNKFGSGHGHEPSFKELEEVYTRLAVSASTEFISFYLKVFKSQLSNIKSNES